VHIYLLSIWNRLLQYFVLHLNFTNAPINIGDEIVISIDEQNNTGSTAAIKNHLHTLCIALI